MKLAFWKKDDEFGDLGKDPFPDLDKGPGGPPSPDDFGSDPFGSEQHTDPMGGMDQFSDGSMNNPEQPINDVGIGRPLARPNVPPPGFDRVTQRETRDPFGNSSPHSGSQFNPMMGKDIEIISAKLDTIRVGIENISHKLENLTQRMEALEAIARDDQEPQKW